MSSDDSLLWSARYDYHILDNVAPHGSYLSDSRISSIFADLENTVPYVAEFQVGDNLITQTLHTLKITNEAGAPEETKFQVLLLGGLYGSQPAGREMLVRLARHLLAGYKRNDPNVTDLLKNAVIHIIPVVDSSFGGVPENRSVCHQPIAHSSLHNFGILNPWPPSASFSWPKSQNDKSGP
ncbi:hypothetical protein J437_LFUL018715 [Ladona fulva]|uniref:Peptidase M14 domain-containing protein n=1 Tax=Ladona fulva TaxID=123851 RepID=A0A8K0PC19_LADFU|nr:hypothetical protein J437_LFUL018715 [Ladona fulva]